MRLITAWYLDLLHPDFKLPDIASRITGYGVIGSRAGLRIQWSKDRESSTLSIPTNPNPQK